MNSDSYNIQRKRILEKLDKKEEVSILELGMYDLTPYFKDKFDVSLNEAIMLNKNIERKIKHIDENLFFSPPQYRALDVLFNYDRIILSAPTSFGKTLLVKEYIYLENPNTVVYIVPTNALAYELEKSFKYNKNFSQYTIFDKCSSNKKINNEKLLFIGTQEKFLEINEDVLNDIDLFVIDEAYKLSEKTSNLRGYKLSETFLDSIARKSKKIFLLTPKAKFNGFDNYGFKLFESSFNAVEKNYVILKEINFFDKLLEKSKNEKTILFCKTPMHINTTYKCIKRKIKDVKINNFIKTLETDIHPDWNVVKLLKAGILTHHGQMPKYVQNKMIELFDKNSDYNLLLGTSSISEGINTVTKNLFIYPKCNKMSKSLLMKNTVGRAGRLGEYPIGYIYSTKNVEQDIKQDIEITLAISDNEELAEIEDSKDIEKVKNISKKYNLDCDFCLELLNKYKISLSKLDKLLYNLQLDQKYPSISNLPFISKKIFENQYTTDVYVDKILILGYLNVFYKKENQKVFLNNFNNQIEYFKFKCKKRNITDNTQVINLYMGFIYSTLEYQIMPIVQIGLEIKEKYQCWNFGENVIRILEECKKKYYKKTYGNLNVDELSENHLKIIGTFKDYGMLNEIKQLNEELLEELQECLNDKYSTIDVLKAIDTLSYNSKKNKLFFLDIKNKYLL